MLDVIELAPLRGEAIEPHAEAFTRRCDGGQQITYAQVGLMR